MRANVLKGKRIVITRSATAGKAWEDYLASLGALVYRFPTIRTSPISLTEKLKNILLHMDRFGWIVFTSPAGPYYLAELLKKVYGTKLPLEMPRIAVIGKKTAEAVRAVGYRVAFMSSKASSRVLAKELTLQSLPILLLRADIAGSEMVAKLASRGARVVDVPIYRTRILRNAPGVRFRKIFKEQRIDFIVFASPSAVRGFSARVKGKAMESVRSTIAIAFGSDVVSALRDAGFRNIRRARAATPRGIVDAILRGRSYTG